LNILHRVDWRMASQWLVGSWLVTFAVGASGVIIAARRDSVADIETAIYAISALSLMPSAVIFAAAGLVSYSFRTGDARSSEALRRAGRRNTRIAWIAAIVAAVVSLYAAMLGSSVYSTHFLVDTAIIAALALAMRRKSSPWVGFLLFAYYVASRIALVAITTVLDPSLFDTRDTVMVGESWIPSMVLFGLIFWRGALGLLDVQATEPPSGLPAA
jgi:hypothetical protein